MNLLEITDLFRYNDWANDRIVSALHDVSSEALERPLGGSFPTLRATFSHIVGAEWIWLERWNGRSPAARPEWLSSPDLSTLTSHLRDIAERRNALLASESDSSLARSVPFTLINGTSDAHALSDLFVHVVNHSTYHRGQLATMLRQAGASAPSTDFILFRSGQRSAKA